MNTLQNLFRPIVGLIGILGVAGIVLSIIGIGNANDGPLSAFASANLLAESVSLVIIAAASSILIGIFDSSLQILEALTSTPVEELGRSTRSASSTNSRLDFDAHTAALEAAGYQVERLQVGNGWKIEAPNGDQTLAKTIWELERMAISARDLQEEDGNS